MRDCPKCDKVSPTLEIGTTTDGGSSTNPDDDNPIQLEHDTTKIIVHDTSDESNQGGTDTDTLDLD